MHPDGGYDGVDGIPERQCDRARRAGRGRAEDARAAAAEAQRRAKRRLPRSVYKALIAGSERGLTLEDNLRAFGELGLTELFCHAQLPAVGFYAALGWKVEGGVFQEAGIDHQRMVLRPEPPDDDLIL